MKQPIKILTIAFFLERFPCISETFILNQIIYLINQGHIIDIYAYGTDNLSIQPKLLSYDLLNKTTYLISPKGKLNRIKKALQLFLNFSNKKMLLKTIDVFKYGRQAYSLDLFFKFSPLANAPIYDVVHAHFGQMGKDVLILKRLGLFKNIPLITSFHGYDINPIYIENYKLEYKDLFEASKIITANSNFTLNLLNRAGCHENKLIKLPESLDTEYFRKSTNKVRDESIINILFCGRLIAFKSPEMVIEIANELVNKRGHVNLRFHVIGTGDLDELIKANIAKYNLNNDFLLYGAMIQSDIIKVMSDMDIFLYPGSNDTATGRVENQGLVLQEAQSMELAVITSNVGGIPESVIDGATAFILEERDVMAFTEKTELLMADSELRIKMGRQGREFVTQNFDYNILGSKLEECYNYMLTM